MLLDVISFSGLKPQPSYVRRYMSQSPASGCSSRASVTVGYATEAACDCCVRSNTADSAPKNCVHEWRLGFIESVLCLRGRRRFETAESVTDYCVDGRRKTIIAPH